MTGDPFDPANRPGPGLQAPVPVLQTPALPSQNPLKTMVLVVHALYAASFFTGFTTIIGVVIAYMKRSEAVGTIYESHFTYAIRTFWIGLVFGAIFVLLTLILIGIPLLFLLAIWYIVRVVRPVLAIIEDRPVLNPTRYF